MPTCETSAPSGACEATAALQCKHRVPKTRQRPQSRADLPSIVQHGHQRVRRGREQSQQDLYLLARAVVQNFDSPTAVSDRLRSPRLSAQSVQNVAFHSRRGAGVHLWSIRGLPPLEDLPELYIVLRGWIEGLRGSTRPHPVAANDVRGPRDLKTLG
jgi:hypothetical protein